ncbi:hypothetical protein ACK369_07465, partial [Aeromonas veronii]
RQGATVDQGMIVSLFPVNAIWVNSYMGGVAPRRRFFHFLRVCPICSSSVAGCDDWDGFQGSGTVQVISQAQSSMCCF